MQDVSIVDKGEDYKYKFSIVMAVYNVEPFLQEAVDSVLQQNIGFKENVQLILVDDGSKDRSGEICDTYKKEYPDNIVVIHKENGGVSSARNEGLKYIKGKYVNFLDSDDKLSENTLEEVYLFFEQHYIETDVVAIPMYFLDGQTGEHILNYKFKKGSRIIDLRKEYTYSQLSMSSAFFPQISIKNISFDQNLVEAEDAKEVLKILCNKMRLGILKDGKYFYRKRSIGEQSATQNSKMNKKCYIVYLKNFTKTIIEYYKNNMHYLPRYVQYTLMYHLQWKIMQGEIPTGVLTKEEINEYYKLLFQLTSQFDDEIILEQKKLPIEYKVFLLRKKYEMYPSVSYCNQDIGLYFKNSYVTNCCNHKLLIEFLKFQDENIIVEGYGVYIPFSEFHDVQIYCLLNDNLILCEKIKRTEKEKRLNGELVLGVVGFQVAIPFNYLKKEENKISFYMEINGLSVKKGKLSWGPFSPVTAQYQNQYYVNMSWIVLAQRDCIKISKVRKFAVALKEFRFISELLTSKKRGDQKAGLARMAYHFLKLFKNKELWLVSDRVNKADDNGEAFFLYLQSKKNINSYFVISQESTDYTRMRRLGNVLPYFSFKHKLKYLLSDKLISSHADGFTFNPFAGYDAPYRDIIVDKKIIFLQHGITKDDISGWLNRYNKNLSVFVTAAKAEYCSILTIPSYYYSREQVKLTGFPRYDRLKDKRKKIITIMPTWRKYLMKSLDASTGIWNLSEDIMKSDFFEFYNQLINSERLLKALVQFSYELHFMPHPNIMPFLNIFKKNAQVIFDGLEKNYRDIFNESALIITDYSSVAFDFAYLRKPVLYSQFDRDKFFEGEHSYTKGYFDYERDGFGEVCYDLETLVDTIIEYMKNDCQLKDKYRERIDNFFAYNDKNNCQRVYDEIMKL